MKTSRPNPIADVFPVSDIGESDIATIMKAARAFPQLSAYEDESGQWIAIATEKPTTRQFRAFLKRSFGHE